MTKATHDEYRLRLQIEAAKNLIADMRGQHGADIFDGDETFLVDAIEGETSLIEVIEAALAARDEDLMLINGINARMDELKIRKDRLTKTAERKKSLIERAMVAAEIRSLPLAGATLTVAKRAPGLVIVEEADIPSSYFVTPPAPAPRVDKAALTSKLRDRKAAIDAEIEALPSNLEGEARGEAIAAIYAKHPAIPGADLDNGGVSLTIRVK